MKKDKILKIDKHLPQIFISGSKIDLFINWWNTDIRFEKTIPQAFNKGYIVIDDIGIKVQKTDDTFITLVKSMAKSLHTTYRYMETELFNFFQSANHITIYFSFIDANNLYCETYDYDGQLTSTMEFGVGYTEKPEDLIDIKAINTATPTNLEDITNNINKLNLGIIATCLWYLATSKNPTKYMYENKTPIITNRHKNIVNVSSTKTITTPIYNLNKIKTIKVDSLTKQKNGWTYSHSFQVHGHYRHYKSGKTIFIAPFIKGQGCKEYMPQVITLNPKN